MICHILSNNEVGVLATEKMAILPSVISECNVAPRLGNRAIGLSPIATLVNRQNILNQIHHDVLKNLSWIIMSDYSNLEHSTKENAQVIPAAHI